MWWRGADGAFSSNMGECIDDDLTAIKGLFASDTTPVLSQWLLNLKNSTDSQWDDQPWVQILKRNR
jgi:hypothetical protein